MVVYQYYTLKMRKRKGENLQNSSTMVFFPLYFIMDSGYTNEVSVYKLYLLGVNLSVIGRVLGQAFLRTTSPSRLRRATSPGRGGFGSPRKVNGFARGSPTRGAVERSETERLYEGKPDREPPAGLPSPSALARCHLSQRERLSAPFCSKNFLKIHFIGLLFCYTPVRTKRHRREQE